MQLQVISQYELRAISEMTAHMHAFGAKKMPSRAHSKGRTLFNILALFINTFSGNKHAVKCYVRVQARHLQLTPIAARCFSYQTHYRTLTVPSGPLRVDLCEINITSRLTRACRRRSEIEKWDRELVLRSAIERVRWRCNGGAMVVQKIVHIFSWKFVRDAFQSDS